MRETTEKTDKGHRFHFFLTSRGTKGDKRGSYRKPEDVCLDCNGRRDDEELHPERCQRRG